MDQWTEGETGGRVTLAQVCARFEVSPSTIGRRRKEGRLPSAEWTGKGARWTFAAAEVLELAEAERWPVKSGIVHRFSTTADHAQAPAESTPAMHELGELRATVSAHAAERDRLAAERDRARSDLEQRTRELDQHRTQADVAERDTAEYRARAETAERDAIEHRARAEAKIEHLDDLAERLDRAETDRDRSREPAPVSPAAVAAGDDPEAALAYTGTDTTLDTAAPALIGAGAALCGITRRHQQHN